VRLFRHIENQHSLNNRYQVLFHSKYFINSFPNFSSKTMWH
jgi:hypothetical protein